MSQKTICVLGGGIGGVVAAGTLKKALGAAGRVILIDKNPDHVFAPSFLWVLAGSREPEQIKRPLVRLERKGIEFINEPVSSIDPEDNSITVGDQTIGYDYLVISLGADSNMPAVPGLEEAAINLYTLPGIERLKKTLAEFEHGEVVLLIPSNPYKCPAAPYEAAFLLDAHLRGPKARGNIDISIYTVEPLPMPGAGPKIGQTIKGLLESRAIGFNPNIAVESIEPTTKEITFEAGEKKRADLLITVPPHQAPDVVKEAGLTNESGWIPVNKRTLATQYENVYAIGDVTTIKLDGRYRPEKPLMLPKAGVFAHEEALVVAARIAGNIKGTAHKSEFTGIGSCMLELGNGTAGFAKGDFYAVPHPLVNMRKPSRKWHYYKILFEKYWFWRWF